LGWIFVGLGHGAAMDDSEFDFARNRGDIERHHRYLVRLFKAGAKTAGAIAEAQKAVTASQEAIRLADEILEQSWVSPKWKSLGSL
jgi:hypothetical protein